MRLPLIHRLWLGPKAMPERYRMYGDQLREMNPGWVVVDWHAGILPPLVNRRVWDDIGARGAITGVPMESPAQGIAVQRADVVGYELILRFGGIYLNCDLEPRRPFDDLPVTVNDAFAGWEDDNFLCNAVLGGPAGHPFFQAVVDELPKRYYEHPAVSMQATTGPQLITKVWKDRGDLVTLPRETFFPVHHSQVPVGGTADGIDVPASAFTVHHWGHRLTGIPS